ncbi:hypothetical protein BD770DRAFT_389393 [Pilaira anomala]|nr:hypothetical protein BD770DRAFT_389393 [Pilaira anomala]
MMFIIFRSLLGFSSCKSLFITGLYQLIKVVSTSTLKKKSIYIGLFLMFSFIIRLQIVLYS